jgi:uncharacterized protein
MYNPQSVNTAERAGVDLGLRAYFLRVYNYMASALILTGLVAYFTAQLSVQETASGMQLTQLGNVLINSPLKWLVMLAPLGMVMFLSFRIEKMSESTAKASFWAFSVLMGLSLYYVFLVFTGTSIARVFFITAGTFGAMSLYGYSTKRDLTGFGSFLTMGVIGIVIASVVNIFLGSTALQMAISVIGVLLFTGLTAYDTQRIKAMYYQVAMYSGSLGKASIMGALTLYLDFINLFIMLLQLFGQRRE